MQIKASSLEMKVIFKFRYQRKFSYMILAFKNQKKIFLVSRWATLLNLKTSLT